MHPNQEQAESSAFKTFSKLSIAKTLLKEKIDSFLNKIKLYKFIITKVHIDFGTWSIPVLYNRVGRFTLK